MGEITCEGMDARMSGISGLNDVQLSMPAVRFESGRSRGWGLLEGVSCGCRGYGMEFLRGGNNGMSCLGEVFATEWYQIERTLLVML
jgi:hypothetical protein